MIRVTLSGAVPIGIDYVPTGTTPGANQVIYANNVPPADFAMNFHTYIVVAGNLVRNAGIPIDNRILTTPTFTHRPAAIVAANTPTV